MDALNQPLLNVRDLSVAFRHGASETLAVDRVSFAIGRGECVALVGESGSGKSVSALSILKLLPYPSASHPSGVIRFKGRDLLTLPENEMRAIRGNDISIIFKEPMTSLNPLHTTEAQIGEVLQLHNGLRGAAARARIVELLTQVGIPEPETRLGSYLRAATENPRLVQAFGVNVPLLLTLRDRVASRPRIRAYLASDKRIAFNEHGIFRRYKALDR